MELGNLLFGKTSKDCTIPFEREVNQELWNYILENGLTGIDNNTEFNNNTFTITPYNWDYEVEDVESNFYHKPSGFKISWYKYPFRDSYCNMEITHEQFRSILYDCLNSLSKYVIYEVNKWWE